MTLSTLAVGLNPRDRALSAIWLEEADRVPVSEYDINMPIASAVLGREALVGYGGRFTELCYRMLSEGRRDELVARMKVDRVTLYEKLRLDVIMVRPVWGKNPEAPRQVAPHEWLVEGPGGHWFRQKFDVMYDSVAEVDSSIARGGLDALEDYVRALWDEGIPEPEPETMELVEYAVKEVGDEILVMGDADGSFPVGGSWLPVFLKAMYVRPDLVRRLLDYSTRRAIRFIEAMIDAGVEAVSGGSDIAYKEGPYMSPRHFREFILPSIRAHADACHRRGVPFLKHTDGNINPILDDFIISSGIDGYLAVEPRAGMDIADLKRRYGDSICFFGNVDCAYTLVYGSEADVRGEVRRLIDSAAHGGGLIVASSNSAHSFVKLNNFLAMIDEVKKYGIYPLSEPTHA